MAATKASNPLLNESIYIYNNNNNNNAVLSLLEGSRCDQPWLYAQTNAVRAVYPFEFLM